MFAGPWVSIFFFLAVSLVSVDLGLNFLFCGVVSWNLPFCGSWWGVRVLKVLPVKRCPSSPFKGFSILGLIRVCCGNAPCLFFFAFYLIIWLSIGIFFASHRETIVFPLCCLFLRLFLGHLFWSFYFLFWRVFGCEFANVFKAFFWKGEIRKQQVGFHGEKIGTLIAWRFCFCLFGFFFLLPFGRGPIFFLLAPSQLLLSAILLGLKKGFSGWGSRAHLHSFLLPPFSPSFLPLVCGLAPNRSGRMRVLFPPPSVAIWPVHGL